MDATHEYRWHARAYPVTAMWPLVPPLMEDEIISSWLVRCALAQGCDPLTLTGSLWPEMRYWCTDPDRGAKGDQLVKLAEASGISATILEGSTLTPVQRALTGAAEFPKGVTPWILCLGMQNRRRCGGLQYCPQCFLEGAAHYRIQDRLSWHTVCSVHQVTLLDRCECCDAPLCPQMLEPPETGLTRCHRCRFELTLASTTAADMKALRFQQAADELLCGNPQMYGEEPLLISDWFYLSKWMVGVLRSAERARSLCTKGFFADFGINFDVLIAPATGLPFEYLKPEDRARLLANVWLILQAGPERFVQGAARECIAPSLFPRLPENAPACLTTLISELRALHKRAATSKKIEAPRSQKSVLMRWQRLLRKIQR